MQTRLRASATRAWRPRPSSASTTTRRCCCHQGTCWWRAQNKVPASRGRAPLLRTYMQMQTRLSLSMCAWQLFGWPASLIRSADPHAHTDTRVDEHTRTYTQHHAPPPLPHTHTHTHTTLCLHVPLFADEPGTFWCNPPGAYNAEFRAELFRPPYAFAGARPSIVEAPAAAVTLGDAIAVTYTGQRTGRCVTCDVKRARRH